MSAYPPGSHDSQSLYSPQIHSDLYDEPGWLELLDTAGPSPAAVWVPDEQDEITIQSQRQAPKEPEVCDHAFEKAEVKKAGGPVRVLDEWSVLPSEASYATIKLNQVIEQTVAKELENARTDSFEEQSSARPGSQRRLLDESQVLPGEASFATILLNQPTADRSYSPITEFLVKTNLNLTATLLATLSFLGVVLISASVFLAFKIRDNNSGTEPKKATLETMPHAAQDNKLEPNEQVESGVISNQTPRAISLVVKDARIEGVVTKESKATSDAGNSDVLRKPSHESAKEEARLNPPINNGKPIASKEESTLVGNKRYKPAATTLRSSVKETSKVRKMADPGTPGPKNNLSKAVLREQEASLPKATESAKEEPGITTVMGEGVRPRRVLP